MVVTKIALGGFRNHRGLSMSLSPQVNVITGENGKGKTNVVEALYLATTGDSFRPVTNTDMIMWGRQTADVEVDVEGDGRELSIKVEISDKKTFFINHNKKKIQEVSAILPSVVFTPDDLRLVKGSSSRKRASLDKIGGQLSESYRRMGKEYEKVVLQRNSLLKDPCTPKDCLDAWTASLLDIGLVFFKHRLSLFKMIKGEFEGEFRKLYPGREVEAKYTPSWERKYLKEEKGGVVRRAVEVGKAGEDLAEADDDREKFEDALEAAEGIDREKGVCSVGPHRDDIEFYLDGKTARTFASQGQQRMMTLAWKMAEVRVIEQITGKRPLVLLDDVMSEFDSKRKEALFGVLGEGFQTVITTTDAGSLGDIEKDCKIIHIA